MRKENKIDCVEKIGETAWGTRSALRDTEQGCENMLDCQRRGHGDAGIMAPKGVEPMRIRGGDQWFAKTRRHPFRAAIRIKEAYVKMAELDCVEAIYFSK